MARRELRKSNIPRPNPSNCRLNLHCTLHSNRLPQNLRSHPNALFRRNRRLANPRHSGTSSDILISMNRVNNLHLQFPAVAMTICAFIGTHYGWGRHIWDIPVRWYGPSLKVSYLTQIIFIIAATLIKLSICFSYRRISIDKSFHRILKYTTFTVLLYGVAFTVALVFRCWPINAYWSTLSAVRSGQCFNENVVLLLSSGINFVIDIWLVVLPVPSLWRLQLPMKQRTILVILMSLGFV
jgi:hypothetical protein